MSSQVSFQNVGKVYRLKAVQFLPISLEEAWDFFSNPKNLKQITPPNLGMTVLSGAEERMFAGQVIQYKVTPLPLFKTTWVTEITHVEDKKFFVDEQRFGPYSLWHHKHFFKEVEGGVEMEDIVDYVPPFGILGRIVNPILVKPRLKDIFSFRKVVLEKLFPA